MSWSCSISVLWVFLVPIPCKIIIYMYLKAFIHIGEIDYSLVHSSLQLYSQVEKVFWIFPFWVYLEATKMMCVIGNILSATFLYIVQFSHYWYVMKSLVEVLFLFVGMQNFGWLHWCWIGGRFRIFLSQALHYFSIRWRFVRWMMPYFTSVNVCSQEVFKSSFHCNSQVCFIQICHYSVQLLFICAFNYWFICIEDLHDWSLL